MKGPTVADVGEKALVRRLVAGYASRANVAGLADDAAVIPWGGTFLVLTTDMLQRRTHFPEAMTPEEAGAYAVNASLSDLAATGAEPVGVLVALGLPPAIPVAEVERLRDGVQRAAEAVGAEVLGGDTKEHVELTVGVTAVGRAERPLFRSGAAPGDVLAVTGDLGAAAAGFAALAEGGGRDAAARALRPVPHVPEGRALAGAGASACMDASDGFASAVHDLARASGASFVVDAGSLPIAPEAARRPGARELALYGAGDYGLVATVPAARWDEAEEAVRRSGGALAAVGRVVAGSGARLADGEPLEPRGWEHFRARQA